MSSPPRIPVQTPSLRPSRRPLLLMGPLVAAESALVVALALLPGLAFERGVLLLLALFVPVAAGMIALVWIPWRYVLVMASGRTEAGPDGIVNAMIGGPSTTGWPEIRLLEVRRGLFGRRTIAVLKKRRRRRILAAPRDGLLVPPGEFEAGLAELRRVAAEAGVSVLDRPRLSRRTGWTVFLVIAALLLGGVAYLTRPWLDPWFPGRHEVANPPRACGIPGADVPGLPRVAGYHSPRSQESSCTWAPSARRRAGEPSLKVWITWNTRTFSRDAASAAHDRFAERLGDDPYTPVPGLGDEAAEHFYPPDSSGVWGDVVVRRANLVIDVDYGALRPRAEVVSTAERVARVVLADLRAH